MKGPEVAAPAAPAAKSLESAGYPQRRVTACIQTDSKPRRHKKMAVSRGKHPSTPTPPSFTSGPHLCTRSAANCGACSTQRQVRKAVKADGSLTGAVESSVLGIRLQAAGGSLSGGALSTVTAQRLHTTASLKGATSPESGVNLKDCFGYLR